MNKRSSSFSRGTGGARQGARPHMCRAPKPGYQLPSGRARRRRRRDAVYLHKTQGFGRGGRGRRSFRAAPRDDRRPYVFIAVGCAFLLFVASLIWYANRSVDVTVNGETVAVRIHSTVQQYIDDNSLADEYDAGDLLAVDDSVLERGAGERFSVTVDGDELASDDFASRELEGGEELTIDDGADVYEEHDVQATDIAPTITVDGSGSIQYVATWGVPGRSEVWTGHVSGKTQDRGVVKEVVNAEVSAASPYPSQDRKLVALTFDEGPSDYTAQILDVLDEHGATATFFLSGDAVEANPDAARAIADAGCEIGSNTYSDDSLENLDADQVREQITRGFDAIEDATGERVSLLRAPLGAFSDENWCQAMDLVSAVVSWNVDSGDWLLPGADELADTVVGSVRSGSVILMTDSSATGEQVLAALPDIIDRLKEEGYEFVSLSDLVASDEDLADAVDLSKVSMPEDAVLPVIADEQDDGQDGASGGASDGGSSTAGSSGDGASDGAASGAGSGDGA